MPFLTTLGASLHAASHASPLRCTARCRTAVNLMRNSGCGANHLIRYLQSVADVWRVVAAQAADSGSDRNDSQHNSTAGGAPACTPWS